MPKIDKNNSLEKDDSGTPSPQQDVINKHENTNYEFTKIGNSTEGFILDDKQYGHKNNLTNNTNIGGKEQVARQKVKCRQSKMIISNNQPVNELIRQIFKEFAKFNEENISDTSILEPFEYRYGSLSINKNGIKSIRSFLKKKLPIEATTLIEKDGTCTVFGTAIAGPRVSMINKCELSNDLEVTVLKMFVINK